MKVKVIGDKKLPAVQMAEELIGQMGLELATDSAVADVAIAPLLTEILPLCEILKPRHGTLIFHPSPLPYGRGASAIKWAYKRAEPITAATWFWADAGIDSGPICEQEIVKIDYNVRPKDFYELHILPAMERTLKRCLINLQRGFKREIVQVADYATYDKKL